MNKVVKTLVLAGLMIGMQPAVKAAGTWDNFKKGLYATADKVVRTTSGLVGTALLAAGSTAGIYGYNMKFSPTMSDILLDSAWWVGKDYTESLMYNRVAKCGLMGCGIAGAVLGFYLIKSAFSTQDTKKKETSKDDAK